MTAHQAQKHPKMELPLRAMTVLIINLDNKMPIILLKTKSKRIKCLGYCRTTLNFKNKTYARVMLEAQTINTDDQIK